MTKIRSVGSRPKTVLVSALLLCGAAAGSALAQPVMPEPGQAAAFHSAQAAALYNTGRFDEAIVEYELAYSLNRDSAFLFYMASAHRQAGRLTLALATYQRLLAAHPDTPFRMDANGFIAELRTRLEYEKESRPTPAPAVPAPPPAPDASAVIATLGPPVPVQFVSGLSSTQYQVKIFHDKLEQARATHLGRACETPCSVEAFAGSNTVQVSGPSSFYRSVAIPPYPVTLELKHGQTTMREVGKGFVGSGAVIILLVGLPLFELAPHDRGVAGAMASGAGALCGIIGGILWGAARSHSIVVKPSQAMSRFGTQTPRLTGLGIAPRSEGGAALGTVVSF